MARISPDTGISVYKIGRWLGLNENPDGDTGIKMGEAAEMRNFKITRGGSLQLRPGTQTKHRFNGPVRGMWNGNVDGREVSVCAAAGGLWELGPDGARKIGELTDAPTEFFGYARKLYILTGREYMVWSGAGMAAVVAGYRPLVSVAAPPEGGGQSLEGVNKLTGARRARFSPDGAAKTFVLPERAIASVDYVKNTATGAALAYTASLAAGTVTFAAAPAKGVDTIEIGWTHPQCDRAAVERMRFSELYSGVTDARVFLYGDGSSMAIYSGLDYDGAPSAEYFPELNVLHAGEANTPITGMIRHFTSLLIFKTGSAYIAGFEPMTLSDSSVIAAFDVRPINRDIGNVAMGQARLVMNDPLTLYGTSVYEWRYGGGYIDERSARLISGRVGKTLAEFDPVGCRTFDDSQSHEYYIAYGGRAAVYNYEKDTWYLYADFPAECFMRARGDLYIGTLSGEIRRVSREYRSDDGRPLDAVWLSGAVAFGRDWTRKFAPRVYVTMKPEPRALINVTARTNRRAANGVLPVSYGISTLSRVDFRHFSFGTNRAPQTRRLKLDAKKFTYYQLVFQSDTDWSTATILAADVKLRPGADVR